MDQSSTPDLDALDASWGEEDDDDEPEDGEGESGAADELEALESGWEAPKRHKTAAERAAARKDKARKQIERRKARAAQARSKQKQKQRPSRSERPPRSDAPRSTRTEKVPACYPHAGRSRAEPRETRNEGASEDGEDAAPTPRKPARKAKRPAGNARRRDWQTMAVIVGIVIAVGAGALWLFGK